jgi:hypothetical protein
MAPWQLRSTKETKQVQREMALAATFGSMMAMISG